MTSVKMTAPKIISSLKTMTTLAKIRKIIFLELWDQTAAAIQGAFSLEEHWNLVRIERDLSHVSTCSIPVSHPKSPQQPQIQPPTITMKTNNLVVSHRKAWGWNSLRAQLPENCHYWPVSSSLGESTWEIFFRWPDSELSQGKQPFPQKQLLKIIRGNNWASLQTE